MYRAIIFDMDDTLIQTKKAKYAAHKHTAKKFYNLKLTDDDISRHWGKPFSAMVEGIYGGVDPLDTIQTNYYSISSAFPIRPYKGALELLTKLTKRYPLGLVTAANRHLTKTALGESHIDPSYFSYIQTSDDTSYHKPDPQVFLPLLAYFGQLGINHNDLLYVGDSLDDLRAARGAGLAFVALAGHTTDQAIFAEAHATSITDFSELISLVLK